MEEKEIISSYELVITAKINGEDYESVLEIQENLSDEGLENIKRVVIKGFKEIAKLKKYAKKIDL